MWQDWFVRLKGDQKGRNITGLINRNGLKAHTHCNFVLSVVWFAKKTTFVLVLNLLMVNFYFTQCDLNVSVAHLLFCF